MRTRARATGRPQSGALNYSSRARRDLRRPSSYKTALVKILGPLPLSPPPRRTYNIIIRDGKKRASSDKINKRRDNDFAGIYTACKARTDVDNGNFSNIYNFSQFPSRDVKTIRDGKARVP